MRISDAFLTYCMNVHPAASADDVLANLKRYPPAVRDRVCPGEPFGVGLWVPAAAMPRFRADLDALRRELQRHRLYVFTLNGFPYGTFHGRRVKHAVYRPDWDTEERLAYTVELLELLAELLPEGVDGSISTLPVTYGKHLPPNAVANLVQAAAAAHRIHHQRGRRIVLALEPEPDCYLETAAEAVRFFEVIKERLAGLEEYLGVCFDTCHLAIQGEHLADAYETLRSHGIPVPKLQISAALIGDNRTGAAAAALAPYDDPVYLHQTRVFGPDGVQRYEDLGDALRANPPGLWRVHFHVPLTFGGSGVLGTTATDLTPDFFRAVLRPGVHLEVETYTFDVLPGEKSSVVESVAGELLWLRDLLPL